MATPIFRKKGGTLRLCEHCQFKEFNLGLESLAHLCKCACVQDFFDFQQFEQQRFDTTHFSKHRMVVRSSTPRLAISR